MEEWKKLFYEFLGAVDTADLRIDVAHALKMKNLPKFLYKYRPPTEYAFNNLEDDTIWLNKPSDYNDPFEFVEFLDDRKAIGAIGNHMQDEILPHLLQLYPIPEEVIGEAKLTVDTLRTILHHQLRNILAVDAKSADLILDGFDEIMGKNVLAKNIEKIELMQDAMKVCSFCESPEQLLMWGHYTDCHKGFCVEYNISKWAPDDIRNRLLLPVRYEKDIYDSTEHLISVATKQVFNNLYPLVSGATKSAEWEYEKEWRFIFNLGKTFPTQNYPMDCQTSVYIGSRMTELHKERIIDICRKRGLKLIMAKPSFKRYQMEFEEIKMS